MGDTRVFSTDVIVISVSSAAATNCAVTGINPTVGFFVFCSGPNPPPDFVPANGATLSYFIVGS